MLVVLVLRELTYVLPFVLDSNPPRFTVQVPTLPPPDVAPVGAEAADA